MMSIMPKQLLRQPKRLLLLGTDAQKAASPKETLL